MQIPSLQDYVLVESELDAELRLDSLNLQIPLQRIYAKVLWLEYTPRPVYSL